MKSEQDILPHSDFKQIDERLWVLEGELPHHNPLPRSMTVYKMQDGGLWIHSAIALDDATQKKLEALGTPKYLVVPNTMHRLDAPIYRKTYPHIIVVCPAAARKKVEEKIHVDQTCEEAFADGEIRALSIPGASPIELSYELQLESGKALIMTDLLVNVPEVPGVGGMVLKHLGRIGFFRTPPMAKLVFHLQKNPFKLWLMSMSRRSDLKIVTVSHGQPITSNISLLLQRAALQV